MARIIKNRSSLQRVLMYFLSLQNRKNNTGCISERKCLVQTQLLDSEAGINARKSASAKQEVRVHS